MTELAFDETKLIREVVQADFYEFFKESWGSINEEELKLNWHLELLCEELQKVAERVFRGLPKLYDLIINISPGTTKSSIASISYVPWMWTRMPHLRAICGSHTQDLVLDLSRKSRDIIESEWYQRCFPEIRLREDQNTKGYFINTRGGMRFSCTVGGKTPTGMHGHIQLIDDPIDPAEALSDLTVNRANAWMDETLSTRKVDKALTPLILVMQRLSQNDPSGHILMSKNKKIRHICLPAEASEHISPPELRRFYRGGLMDPERLSKDVLNEFKERGEYFYAGQFLQHPVPPGGGMFKVDRLKVEKQLPPNGYFKKIVRFWDKAGSTKKGAAWTVGVKMAMTNEAVPQFWILHVDRFREESASRERKIIQNAHGDGHETYIGIEQEGASGGKESAENTVARLHGYRVKIHLNRGDKEWRADPFSTQVNAGNVHILEGHWNREYIEELKYFPFSRYKDQVDASSGAFGMLFRMRRRVGAF